jgi:hypothetical protein
MLCILHLHLRVIEHTIGCLPWTTLLGFIWGGGYLSLWFVDKHACLNNKKIVLHDSDLVLLAEASTAQAHAHAHAAFISPTTKSLPNA